MSEHLKDNRVVRLDSLIPHPRNFRTHPDEQVRDLILSLQRFGQGRSIVIQDAPQKQLIVAGHGIVEAAKVLEWEELRADILPASWTPEQITGYLVADNLHSQKASDDDELLATLLQEQQNAGYDLATMGSDDEALRQMLEELGNAYLGDGDQEEEDEPQEHKAGSLLALLNVTIADPTHQVHTGEVWTLGKHVLICAHVFKDWSLWTQYLTSEQCLFLPFAGPLVPLSKKADSHTLVMVQPDTYIAGHVLDRYAEIHGQHSVKLVKQVVLGDEREQDEEGEDESDE